MRRVFLYAYDRANFGDDLFVHAITGRYPHVQFYMWSDKPNQLQFRTIKNLKVLDQHSRFVKFLTKVRASLVSRYRAWYEKRCDAIVYIGGSIFIEYENWRQILGWWKYEAKTYPLYVVGANFGPYKTESYRDELAEIMRNMQDICFREKYSFEKFSDVPGVRMAPDILFSYPMRKDLPVKKQIFVSMIDCGKRTSGLGKLCDYEEAYMGFLKGFLTEYLQQGYQLVFVSFCEKENDFIAIKKMLSILEIPKEDKRIQVIGYNGTNISEVTDSLSESELVIATRFHAAILGFAAGKPVLPVVYSDKTIHVLEDAEFQGIYLDVRNMQGLDAAEFNKNMERQKLDNIDELSKLAEGHFEKLDKVLKE